MSYKITEDCSSCGACESECPNNAISQGDDTYKINGDLCTECVGFHNTPQCADVCPTESVILDPNHKEDEATLIKKLKKIHPNKTFSGDIPSRFRG